jgi:thymidylate kinase
MAPATCAVCATGFVARSDAVYCSSACRQKAHRARTARRVAALARVSQRSQVNSDDAKLLQLAAANSMQRARQRIKHSLELCRTSAKRIQEAAVIREQSAATRLATVMDRKRPPWPGT